MTLNEKGFITNLIIDKYKAYQILDDEWNTISGDIEIIQSEGIKTCNNVDPKTEIKKKIKSSDRTETENKSENIKEQ